MEPNELANQILEDIYAAVLKVYPEAEKDCSHIIIRNGDDSEVRIWINTWNGMTLSYTFESYAYPRLQILIQKLLRRKYKTFLVLESVFCHTGYTNYVFELYNEEDALEKDKKKLRTNVKF